MRVLQQLIAYVKPETQEVAVKFKQTEIMKVDPSSSLCNSLSKPADKLSLLQIWQFPVAQWAT